MLKFRQIGAPRISQSRRVVLDLPHVTSDGVIVGDGNPDRPTIVKIERTTLRAAWRKRANLWYRRGCGDLVLLGCGDENQVWNSNGDVLWSRRFARNPFALGDRLWYINEGHAEVVDFATGRTVELLACPTGIAQFLSDDGNVVFLGPSTQEGEPLRAFELRTQKLLWERKLLGEIRERHGVECPQGLLFHLSSAGRCIADSGTHVFSIAVADGSLRWAQKLGYRAPHYFDGRIYGWSTSGARATTRTTLDTVSREISRETVAPATYENRFVILDEDTGAIIVDRPLAKYGPAFDQFLEPLQGTPCRNHMAFTVADTGLLVLFRLSDGEMVWHHEYDDELFGPVNDDNRLYVRCANGTLVVLEAEGGEL